MGATSGIGSVRAESARAFWRPNFAFPTNWVAFATVIVAAVAMAEIDRMIEQCVTAFGESYSMARATGLLPDSGAWYGWATSPVSPARLIGLHAAWDILFAAGYTLPGYRLFKRVRLERIAAAWVLLLGIEILESGIEIVLASRLNDASQLKDNVSQVLVDTAFSVGVAKWLFLAVLLLAPLLPKGPREELAEHLKTWFEACRPHSAQLIGIIVIGVFALAPKPNLFDQYPDLVRSWVVDTGLHAGAVVDTVVAFVYFSVGACILGRLGTKARSEPTPLRPPGVWPWLVVPLTVVGATIVGWRLGQTLSWDSPRALIFVAVVTLFACIVIVSAVARRRAGASTSVNAPAALDEGAGAFTSKVAAAASDELARMGRAGDLVAGLVLVVFGAGLVRAFAAPVALRFAGVGESAPERTDAGAADLAFWLCLSGVFIAILLPKLISYLWPYVAAWSARLESWLENTRFARTVKRLWLRIWWTWASTTDPASRSARRLSRARKLTVAACVALVLAWVFLPVFFADTIGPVATIVVVVLLVVVIVWSLQSEVRARKPNAVFEWMGFNTDPVLLVALIVPLVLTVVPDVRGLHPIQSAGETLDVERQSIGEAFDTWYAENTRDKCAVPIPPALSASDRENSSAGGKSESVHVLPLVLVAAEGGGIRAAAWTSRVIDELMSQVACDGGPVFLSSGVSGGAVGLTLSGLAARDDSVEGAGFALARSLADARPLTVSLSGLLVGDLAAGVTGMRIPTDGYTGPNDEMVWQDRAAHLQWAWGNRVDALRGTFDTKRRDAVGWQVLNSSAIGYDCRVVISQLDLELKTRIVTDPTNKARVPSCAGGDPGVANAIDLHELYGKCSLALDWATASLLSARFPVVSPAGRTGGEGEACSAVPDVQLSDGGIVDNSGLATIADLVPEVMALVRAKNAEIAAPSAATPWVVPIVMYISNSPGGDLSATQQQPWSDLAIAVDAQGEGHEAQNSDRAWLQRISSGTIDACSAKQCAIAAAWVRDTVGSGVAVVAPRSGPTVSAPLGWALSDVSLDAIDAEVRDLGERAIYWPTCFGELGHVVDVVNGKEPVKLPIAGGAEPVCSEASPSGGEGR
ncbi:hypothetical protein J7E29_02380 [Streptomyces sp. ISL-90]|nr:hypothetical protein [Streptomyces sp. ISL-90]